MAEHEEGAMFEALPQIDEHVLNFILGEGEETLLSQYTTLWDKDLADVLSWVDADMEGVKASNPGLAALVHGGVDSLTSAMGPLTELVRTEIRLMCFINALLILRALDMQWRKLKAEQERKKRKN